MLRLPATVALFAILLLGDSPRLAYREGAKVTRTWSLRSERTTRSATFELNGDPLDIGLGSTEISTISMEMADRILGATHGRPTQFVRSFESVRTASSTEGFETPEGIEVRQDSGASELAGAEVLFAWSDETGEWSRKFHADSSGEEDWLDDLDPDMDLSALLPDGVVEVGDTWNVPAALLDDLLRPGGDVDVRMSGDEGLREGMVPIAAPSAGDIGRWGELEGEIQATYSEIVERDGSRAARLLLKVDVAGELDLVDALEKEAVERGVEEDYDDAALERTLKGTATIEWDLTAGHFITLEAEFEGSSELSAAWTQAAHGFELAFGLERSETFEVDIEATNE